MQHRKHLIQRLNFSALGGTEVGSKFIRPSDGIGFDIPLPKRQISSIKSKPQSLLTFNQCFLAHPRVVNIARGKYPLGYLATGGLNRHASHLHHAIAALTMMV